MIIWAIGTLIFSLLVCVAAIGASSSVSSTRRQTRAIWTAAIAACVLWPVIMPLLAAARDLAPRATVTPDVTPGTARRLAAQLPPLPAFVEARIELTLVSAWVMASLVLLSRLVRSQRALTRLCTASREQLLDGQRVLVNEHFGPATIGALRPRVTVPAWIVDLDPTLRRRLLDVFRT